MNTDNIFLFEDHAIIDAALDAFEGHRDFPERMPRCEEEDGAATAAIFNFFEEWLTEEVADFYEDGFTAEDDARAVDLAWDFEQAVWESVAWAVDIRSTNASLPR